MGIVMYGCESWTTRKAERRRINAFELQCWRRLKSPLDCKEINPEYSLEGLMPKLKLQYFGHLMQSRLIGTSKKGLRSSSRHTGTVYLHQGSRYCSHMEVGEGHGKLSRLWMRGQIIIAGFPTNTRISSQ